MRNLPATIDYEHDKLAFRLTISNDDVVTVPISALHKGRGYAGGRTGFWTPKQQQGSAAHSSPRRFAR